MKSVGNLSQGGTRHLRDTTDELGLTWCRRVDGVMPQIGCLTGLAHLEPIVVAAHRPQLMANLPEPMDVGVADLPPVDKFNAELEGAVGSAKKLVLIELQHRIEELDHWNGRFPHANGGNVIGLHQPDPVVVGQFF